MNENMVFEGQCVGHKRKVFLNETSAIKKGQGVCFDLDYVTTETGQTASDGWGKRGNVVEFPDSTNNLAFAGVATQNYEANAAGQWIDIWEPGSICEIATLLDTTINSTMLTCVASTGGQGLFHTAGFHGRGTAKALQTMAVITDITGETPGILGSLINGTASIAADGVTLTAASVFTYAKDGDKVHILGGATTADGTALVTPGEYTIASRTNANVVVLTTAACSAASICQVVAVRGAPTILAKLEDGQESGLAEWVTIYTDGSGTTAVAAMVGGMTHISGGITLATGDAIHTLANGTVLGDTKSFLLHGALTTNDYLVTVTAGEQLDGTTDLATMEFDADADQSTLVWGGTKWALTHNAGTGLA